MTKKPRLVGVRPSVAFLGSIVCTALGGWFVVYTALAIYRFHIDAFQMDQFRVYSDYLALPFWESVTMLQNGHPRFVPALLHLTDLYVFGARSHLLLVFGLGCWVATLCLLCAIIRSEPAWTRAEKAATAAFTAGLLAWLASWLRLAWGLAAAEGYLFIGSSALAFWAWIRAHEPGRRPVRWKAAALLAAAIATTSSGGGAAVWPVLVVANLLMRAPRSSHLIIGTLLVGIAVLLGLAQRSGGESIEVDLLTMLRVGSGGLGSIAYHGLLARGGDWMRDWGAPLFGAAAGLGFALWLAWCVVSRLAFSSAGVFFACLATFGAIVSSLPGLVRGELFESEPWQLYHTRYVTYHLLFWLGATLAASRALATHGRRTRIALPWLLGALLLFLVPSQLRMATSLALWSDQVAAAEISLVVGVGDAELWRWGYFSAAERARGAPSRFRERGVAMFREGWHRRIGRPLRGRGHSPCSVRLAEVHTLLGKAPGVKLAGWVTALHSHERPTRLLVVDDGGRLRGMGRIRLVHAPLRDGEPRTFVFDAYLDAEAVGVSPTRLVERWRFHALRGGKVVTCAADSPPTQRAGSPE